MYKAVHLIKWEVSLQQKELLVNTVIGTLKTKTDSAMSRAVPQAQIALPWCFTALLCWKQHAQLCVCGGVSGGGGSDQGDND